MVSPSYFMKLAHLALILCAAGASAEQIPAVPSGKTLSLVATRSLPDGRLLAKDGKVIVMVQGIPAHFHVANGTALRVKVQPKVTTGEYKGPLGDMLTINCYTAIGVQKAPSVPN